MLKPSDLISFGLAKLEAADWQRCMASAPTVLTHGGTGETITCWASWRPVAAIERQAWGFPRYAVGDGLLGVIAYTERSERDVHTSTRQLVRLPRGVRAPANSGACVWAALQLSDQDCIELTPHTVESLRIAAPAAGVSA